METRNIVQTFESVDEIPWCDHLNEISLNLQYHLMVLLVWQDLKN